MLFNSSIKLFDKSDICFCKDSICSISHSEVIKDHTLMYIYSGKLTLWTEDNKYEFRSCECVFIKKKSIIKTETSCEDGKQFNAAYIRLKKGFLREFFRSLNDRVRYSDCSVLTNNVLKVNATPDIRSLFISFLPYYEKNVKPTPLITGLKLKAGIFSLLNMQIGFYSILFDFKEKWFFPYIEFI